MNTLDHKEQNIRQNTDKQFHIRSLIIVATFILLVLAFLLIAIPCFRLKAFVRDVEQRGGKVQTYFSCGSMRVSRWLKEKDIEFFDNTSASVHLCPGLLQPTVRIDDKWMENLRDKTELWTLSICRVNITDTGVSHLESLTNLRVLYLRETNVTDKGLQHLVHMRNLRSLRLGETNVTGKGLQHLVHMRNLRELDLSSTGVTDEGILFLCRLKNLEKLRLNNTRVTDHGLKQLSVLKNLKSLQIEDNQISRSAVEEFNRVLPKCTVFYR